jgi:hypothetical protein
MSSGLPLKADITQYSRHVSKVAISGHRVPTQLLLGVLRKIEVLRFGPVNARGSNVCGQKLSTITSQLFIQMFMVNGQRALELACRRPASGGFHRGILAAAV